jgi:hypothetical protein
MSDATGGTPGSTSSQTAPNRATAPMTSAGIALLTLYFLAVSISSSYALIKIWPPAADSAAVSPRTTSTDTAKTSGDTAAPSPRGLRPTTGGAGTKPDGRNDGGDMVALFWGKVRLDFGGRGGLRLLLIALLSGALGAFVSSAMSFASYLGNREFDRSWSVWYLVRPPVGMVLALLVYFLLRGGLLSPGASVSSVSPYGVAGIAGLMGMFVKEATDKMRDVAAALFQSLENKRRSAPLAQSEDKSGARATTESTAQTSTTVHRYDPGA